MTPRNTVSHILEKILWLSLQIKCIYIGQVSNDSVLEFFKKSLYFGHSAVWLVVEGESHGHPQKP